MLTDSAAAELAESLFKESTTEWRRLTKFANYVRGKQKGPWLPDNAETEYRDIAAKSASNWLGLVVRATAQGLQVDGFSSDTDTDAGEPADDELDAAEGPPSPWEVWQANAMDAQQHALHRAVGTLGYSYIIVFPGEAAEGATATPMPWMAPVAGNAMFADYVDPDDDWPAAALREVKKGTRYELYTDDARYLFTLAGKSQSGTPPFRTMNIVKVPHDLKVCPVVKMNAERDLLGAPQGDVEPVIAVQDRIVDATFTLQMVAKYGAFPQRWIAGLDPTRPLLDENDEPILDDDGNYQYPVLKAYVDHILTAPDNDTKFGQFTAADLGQYVTALEAHIRHLAAITQTPPHYLLGALVNLSAEALAAAEAGLQRKVKDRRDVLGEGYEQAMRLAALAAGNDAAAADESSQVHWADIESRSLAQVADALLKLNQLGVPIEMLLAMIPGWTQTDVAEATAILEKAGDPIGDLLTRLEDGSKPPPDPEVIKARGEAMQVLISAGISPESAAVVVGLDGVAILPEPTPA